MPTFSYEKAIMAGKVTLDFSGLRLNYSFIQTRVSSVHSVQGSYDVSVMVMDLSVIMLAASGGKRSATV